MSLIQSSRSFRPFSRPPRTSSPSPTNSDPSQVLTRLHALFGHSQDDQNSSGASVNRSGSTQEEEHASARRRDSPTPPPPQRDAIKVLIVTWNMGDALPKGDLKVLLGEIPSYSPQPTLTGIPPLPVEHKHPYHIVVVAGQECPTHSGVPRGLGGGIMKGVSVRGAGHKKDKDDKEDKGEIPTDRDKGMELDEMIQKAIPPGSKSPLPYETSVDEADQDPTKSPNPPRTPTSNRHTHHPGSKGWSTMLDDWFCGPTTYPGPHFDITPLVSPGESLANLGTSPPGPIRPSQPTDHSRSSSSTPFGATDPISIPASSHLVAPALIPSPFARSQSSSAVSSSSLSSEAGPSWRPPPPLMDPSHHRQRSVSTPSGSFCLPEIAIEDEPRQVETSGAYVHVVKERLMGMYLSVYVYQGCEHLVQGVDKDFVTAGLAGGRLGNKGGIGISLKLADHTFLFINSHLAAHAGRMGARMANIAKIKSDLKLNCFLPKEDPRANLGDITDRFDSVFWCGDLNFRLEIERLHAEWLVEQKKYAEALMWDQLKAAMSDPKSDPFPGFQEGPIDFPPTFKYDVWKSVKSTNRDLRRSMRVRRPTADSKHDMQLLATAHEDGTSVQHGLSYVPEADDSAEDDIDAPPCAADLRKAPQDSEDDLVIDIASRRSLDSSGYASMTQSTTGTDVEDDDADDDKRVDASAYGSKHRAFEAALKQKTKRFLGLVKMDGILTPSPSQRKLTRRTSRKRLEHKRSQEFDSSSRRTSMSSMASARECYPSRPHTPLEIDRSLYKPPRPVGESQDDSILPAPNLLRKPCSAAAGISPRRPIARRISGLKRNVSGLSMRQDDHDETWDSALEGFDNTADNREGVYDSSKKQRVPSWCDRVLWKAHVIADLGTPHADLLAQVDSRHKPFGRLSHALTNLGEHLRLPIIRSSSIEPAASYSLRFDRPLPPTPPPDFGETLSGVSPSSSMSTLSDVLDESARGLIPAPRQSSPTRTPEPSIIPLRHQPSPISRHSLTDTTSAQASPPAYPHITLNSALSVNFPRSQARPRCISNCPAGPSTAGCLSCPPRIDTTVTVDDTPPSSGSSSRSRQASGGSIRSPSQSSNLDFPVARSEPLHHSRTTTGVPREDQENGFVKFLRDPLNWIHARSTTPPPDVPPPLDTTGRGRGRRLKGEIECLHYGTIDDAG